MSDSEYSVPTTEQCDSIDVCCNNILEMTSVVVTAVSLTSQDFLEYDNQL
jgi:hypothetical protein